MSESDEDSDVEHTCAICGRHLKPNNRSVNQPDLCRECSGEEADVPEIF